MARESLGQGSTSCRRGFGERTDTHDDGDGGSFEFLGLDQGSYTLVVQDFLSDEDSDRFTAVLDNVTPSEDELKVVVPRAALLRGTVLAPDGQPSPRAYVSALFGTIYL
jgi:hypothetical protein